MTHAPAVEDCSGRIENSQKLHHDIGIGNSADINAPPFHLLMTDGDASTPRHPTRVQLRLKDDYLSRRFHLIQEATPPDERQGKDDFWSGASPVEKALASCCSYDTSMLDYDEEGYNEQSYSPVPGALRRDRVVKFVGLLAMHCHTITLRSLALAILERTQEADNVELKDLTENDRSSEDNESLSSGELSDQPPAKMYRTVSTEDDVKMNDASSANERIGRAMVASIGVAHKKPSDHPDSMSLRVVTAQLKLNPPRLLLFFKANGLPILSRWLIEASTPQPPKSDPAKKKTAQSHQDVVSQTGALLLPLLVFLQTMSFDLDAIKESKINKKIRVVEKQLGAIVAQSDKGPLDPEFTHAVAGGLAVSTVQRAVKDLKKIWEDKAAKLKASENDSEAKPSYVIDDPLASLMASLEDRLQTLNDYESSPKDAKSISELQPWLSKIHIAREEKHKSSTPTISKSRQTTEELARREREYERISQNKQDLAKAQEERQALLLKLRAMQRQASVTTAASKNRLAAPVTRNGVRWRDGLGASSRTRKRELLEEVLVFEDFKDK